ncbi:MAG: 16S rRNA (cytidine(1402)-2'-O)-methyltransferase [Bacteroidales bacterium]|jgi:16S rRNA (cytidine1402-2'-O)-methyltransferase|nr:16S rRNA (cytidine(1402)-2'-O)-methyltransferase [Bacteroidales bacterium]
MAKLTVVPTPVGNLEDITQRALRMLKEASFVLAEDTRTSGNLLRHYGIETKLISYHKYNEHQVVDNIVRRIEAGESACLVSDAGTPAISDPGYLIVRHCIDAGIDVECLPGATAFVPALVSSGLPNDKFCFEGFLPHKKGRKTAIERLASETRTMIIYESPFRLTKTLAQLAEAFGADRQASVSREISKIHEETVRGTLTELVEHFTATPPRGEIVMVVAGCEKIKARDDSDEEEE